MISQGHFCAILRAIALLPLAVGPAMHNSAGILDDGSGSARNVIDHVKIICLNPRRSSESRSDDHDCTDPRVRFAPSGEAMRSFPRSLADDWRERRHDRPWWRAVCCAVRSGVDWRQYARGLAKSRVRAPRDRPAQAWPEPREAPWPEDQQQPFQSQVY